jgi:hypothetical protein
MRRRASLRVARARVRVARMLQRSLIGPIAGQIPGAAWVRSVVERLHEPLIARHVIETWMRTPATIEHYDFPPHFPSYFRRTKAFDERHAYRLRDVVVSPYSGLVWLPRGPVLAESYGSLIRLLGWGDVRSELLTPVQSRPESVIPFPSMPYYHWLLEIVPAALFSLVAQPDSWLLLPTGAHKYVTDLADMIAPGRVTYASGVCRVKECIVAAREPLPGFVQRAEIERLRVSFSRSNLVGDWPTRIYVSRRKDAARPLANEREVEAAMRREGIAVVYTQDLSVLEQMSLFSSAELVVAPHGAGLTNLVWADQIRQVVEIFPTHYFNDCFARLSRMVGADYRYVVSKADSASVGIVPIEDLLATIAMHN